MATRMGWDGILTAVVKGGSRTELSGFKDCYTELSVVDGLLVPGERLVIPRELRVAVLEAAHEGCHGRDSMLHQLRVAVLEAAHEGCPAGTPCCTSSGWTPGGRDRPRGSRTG